MAIWGNSLRMEIFTIFLNFFGCTDKEYLVALLKKITIGFAYEKLWGDMSFLMEGEI